MEKQVTYTIPSSFLFLKRMEILRIYTTAKYSKSIALESIAGCFFGVKKMLF